MSSWAEDPELFLHKGKDGVVHLLRCKEEMSSMLMKPEDFTDEGEVTDLRSLTGGCYDWDKNKYDALIDYIYPRHLLVNCHGSVIVELEPDEKSVLALLFILFFLLFEWLLVNLFHINKKASAVVYIRALDILDMGSYGPGPDHPGRAVPAAARTVKYLQDGTVVQTEPTPKEVKLTEELAIKSKEVETSQQELVLANEKTEVELAKNLKLTEELAIKSKEVETLQQELLVLAKQKTEVELAKNLKLTEELVVKSKEVETLQQELLVLLKVNTVRIYPKAAMDCSLTIRNGDHVVLGSINEFDVYQYWVKHVMYWVKGFEYPTDFTKSCGLPCFALVNKFTGQALKPSITDKHLPMQVQLVPFNSNVIDESILWLDYEKGEGYIGIRKATDTSFNLDALIHNDIVGDGTIVGLKAWLPETSQMPWKIVPY